VKRALVIDASPDVRKLASLVLGDAGFEVRAVGDELDALENVKQFQPDLVMIDMALPKMRDLHLLKKIQEAAPKSRVGILTSNPGDPAVERARDLGIGAFILKAPGIVSFLKTLESFAAKLDAPSDGASQAKPTILVVDDEEPIRGMLKRFLEKRGYEVSTAANGEEALKAVRAQKPGLVLLDVAMPGMDGLKALEKIKSIAPETGVMMITGNTDGELAKECMKRGAFDYIGKPFNFDYLENSVMAKILLLTS